MHSLSYTVIDTDVDITNWWIRGTIISTSVSPVEVEDDIRHLKTAHERDLITHDVRDFPSIPN